MRKQTVLFLCTGNFYRSRYAEELLNHLAAKNGSPWRATSRGLYHILPHPETEGAMSPYTIKALEAAGVAIHGRERMPQPATVAELEQADMVIALQESEHRPMLAANYPEYDDARVVYWHIGDVAEMPASEALPEIDTAVCALVTAFAQDSVRSKK